MNMKRNFDILIIGGGVAGMSAAIYAKRRGKTIAIIEKFSLGGQVNTIPKIENFPSIASIDGFSLAQNFAKQIENLGVEVIYDDIQKVNYLGRVKRVFGRENEYEAKSVILATGLSYVELGKNENEFLGRGVSYCAVCDAHFFRGKHVCVASKRGSGLKEAFVLAEVCESVTILDSGDMSAYAKANKNPKIQVLSNVNIEKVLGKNVVEGVEVSIMECCEEEKKKAKKTNVNLEMCNDMNVNIAKPCDKTKTAKRNEQIEKKVIKTDALFVALGKKPDKIVFGGVKVDAKGFVVTDEKMQTSINGVFAVGDVRSKELKQIVTACSDGAIAGQFA